MTTINEAKKQIAAFIKDFGNKGIDAEYRAASEKWLFVEHNILDMLDLPASDALVNYAEDILGEV